MAGMQLISVYKPYEISKSARCNAPDIPDFLENALKIKTVLKFRHRRKYKVLNDGRTLKTHEKPEQYT